MQDGGGGATSERSEGCSTSTQYVRKVRLTLHEGFNHQVKRMLGALGGFVESLHREALGPLSLDRVAEGEVREVTVAELRALAALLPAQRSAGARAEEQKAASLKRGGGKKTHGQKKLRRKERARLEGQTEGSTEADAAAEECAAAAVAAVRPAVERALLAALREVGARHGLVEAECAALEAELRQHQVRGVRGWGQNLCHLAFA
eukprot:SAG11_NODE_1905_length_4085_cov_6.851480_3_plen_205_part_00